MKPCGEMAGALHLDNLRDLVVEGAGRKKAVQFIPLAACPLRAPSDGYRRITTVTCRLVPVQVTGGALVPWARLERATYCLGGSCSIR
jgi:hypothetical protein